MTVPYRMADGSVVDVETTNEVAELLAAYERQDASERRKRRRHNDLSIDAISESCAREPISRTDLEAEYIEQEEIQELAKAIDTMNDDNRRLIQQLYFEGISARTIATQKKITFQAIYKLN